VASIIAISCSAETVASLNVRTTVAGAVEANAVSHGHRAESDPQMCT
jgi:hypothetical protein